MNRVPTTKRTSPWRWLGYGLLGLLLAGALLGGGWLAVSWKKPLGPTFTLPTRPAPSAPASAAGLPSAAPDSGAGLPSSTPSADPDLPPADPSAGAGLPSTDPSSAPAAGSVVLPTAEPLCGGPAELVILAVAADSDDENYLYGLADAIRIIRVDFVTPRVAVFSVPRDLWVDIPGIASHYNITAGKINQAYLYGNPGLGYYTGPGEGLGLLALTIIENFGIYVDHYGAVNMRLFVDIVDALGGVDIYLEETVDGRDAELGDYGYYPAGWNHLSGQQALYFSRVRNVGGTNGRDNRQTKMLLALREKALQPQTLVHIPDMIDAFIGRVQTDLTPEQIQQLTCLATRIDREKIEFDTIPERLLREEWVYSEQLKGETYTLQGDYAEIGRYIEGFLYGAAP